jgi:hypothetical protein
MLLSPYLGFLSLPSFFNFSSFSETMLLLLLVP